MIDKELLKSKMSDIQGYFKEMEDLLKEDSRDIIGDKLKLYTTERLFQLIVDTSVDINTHIIAESGMQPPNDYQGTFRILAENKILPMEFALKISPSVGLRNLVVHKYGKVDLKKMIEDIKSEIGQYLEYLKYINEYIEK
ncbi:MAG: hypothetical protein COV00_02840 [Candidatus Tagabacteria bacterium CG10_big_fil_rev_8_21_14_0_10_40_13]|uniref:DUF86 domain-containing protein n=1 Tax=Candidatus Tagabacteria bacterium CG10_big_fil_rev_8_21_14_0_10_40_13 TaxID=1975022 RepID=A0A2M8L8C7_9BACT|nr:MAG: hypothetical protein COV00_02840 [Candidatus Tagabacteria bacterium CG10_big_fil_rev_8_21_14_0_10_40_13]